MIGKGLRPGSVLYDKDHQPVAVITEVTVGRDGWNIAVTFVAGDHTQGKLAEEDMPIALPGVRASIVVG